jgi:hypothetical protein
MIAQCAALHERPLRKTHSMLQEHKAKRAVSGHCDASRGRGDDNCGASDFTVAPLRTRRAIKLFLAGAADFRDYRLGRANPARGCETTLTFDCGAAGSPAFQRLSA